jgi:hypothetical protein
MLQAWRCGERSGALLSSAMFVYLKAQHWQPFSCALLGETLSSRHSQARPLTLLLAPARSLSAPENLLTDDMMVGRWRRSSISSVSSCNSPPSRVRHSWQDATHDLRAGVSGSSQGQDWNAAFQTCTARHESHDQL